MKRSPKLGKPACLPNDEAPESQDLWLHHTTEKLTGEKPELGGDVDAVLELKKQPGNDLHIMGSGALIQTLARHDLIDEYMLSIHPLVVGSGLRLFPDGVPLSAFDLVDSKATTKGVVIVTYRPSHRPVPVGPGERSDRRG